MTDSSATNSDGYRLGRSYLAASRLNLQHFMYKDAQGFLLHPVIQADLHHKQEEKQNGSKDSLRVADLATGTAIWLFDLIKSPEVSGLDVQFQGFDISRALFPHSSWLPKNIVLSTSNLLEEPPRSLHGQFDAVHLRLVLSLIRSGSPKPIIQHAKMLLKPGGYLQWDELDPFNHFDVLTPESRTNAPNMKVTFQNIKDLADWRLYLKRVFKTRSNTPMNQDPRCSSAGHIKTYVLLKSSAFTGMEVMMSLERIGENTFQKHMKKPTSLTEPYSGLARR
ncbi:hypothetical protein CHU98_g4820 [Xylaria longipes]|nr:hypothetical protein CHU98_g4820 [Xylaria longipes]